MNKQVFAVLGGKGGVGKTFTAVTTMSAMIARGIEVVGRETDTTNSSLGQVGLCTEPPWDLRDVTSEGSIAQVVELYGAGYTGNVVIDLGARDEELFCRHVGWFAEGLKAKGAKFCVLRPLTLNIYTAGGAVDFAVRFPKIPQVLLLNLGQGRQRKDFEMWDRSANREQVMRGLTVEMELKDFSPILADNATAFQLSLGDIIAGNFGGVDKEVQTYVTSIFTTGRRKFIEVYLNRYYLELTAALKALSSQAAATVPHGASAPHSPPAAAVAKRAGTQRGGTP